MNTKERILHAAINLWAKNINTSLEDIAQHLNLSRRTIHRHYQGKEDLINRVLEYLLDSHLESITQQLVQAPNEPIGKLKKLFYNDIKQSERYVLFSNLQNLKLPNTSIDEQKTQEIIDTYRHIFVELLEEKLLSNLMTLTWLEMFYTSVINSAIQAINNNGVVEDIIFIAWQTFWHGIKASE